MKNKLILSHRLTISTFVMSLFCLSSITFADTHTIAEGKGLTLEQSLRMAIAKSTDLIIESVQVELAKADELSAADPFDINFKTSFALEGKRGYQFADEFQKVSSATNGAVPASTFMTEHQNNSELKSSVNKVFRNGIYTELSVALQSSDSDKTNADFNDVVGALNATGLTSGASSEDYSPLHPSTISLTINIPLLKFSGEDNIATANERKLRYEREAASMNLNQKVANIIKDVFTKYWNYQASLTQLKFTEDAKAQVERWLKNASADSQSQNQDRARHISYLNGYKTELSVNVSKAEEAANIAKSELAQVLGISSADAKKITKLSEQFPLDWSQTLAQFDEATISKKWNELADINRFDLQAAKLQLDAANSIHNGAKNDEKPKLDLSLVATRPGLGMGGNRYTDFSSLNDGGSDLGYAIQLSFEKKIGNSKASATVSKTRFLILQKESEYNNTKRSIGIAVDSAVNSLYNSLIALKAAKEQSENYVIALNEIVKNDTFDLANVYNLVSVDKARLQSFIDNVTAVKNVANAVGNARFQTGTMIKKVDNVHQVEVNDLTKLP